MPFLTNPYLPPPTYAFHPQKIHTQISREISKMVNFTFVVDEFLVESPRLSNDDAISAMLEEMRQANAIRKTELQEAVKEASLQATRVVIKRPEKKA